MGVLNEAFDVLVLRFGVQKRIYCNVSCFARHSNLGTDPGTGGNYYATDNTHKHSLLPYGCTLLLRSETRHSGAQAFLKGRDYLDLCCMRIFPSEIICHIQRSSVPLAGPQHPAMAQAFPDHRFMQSPCIGLGMAWIGFKSSV